MNELNRAWITECPRDAMQGLSEFIPTAKKIEYINSLLEVGFDRLDFGSFVSPKAIPQLRDTEAVLNGINSGFNTKLLAIVANARGAESAAIHNKISLIGFPFSISETFQKRNTNSGIEESFETVRKIKEITARSGQDLLIYISMAYGNPYGDIWNSEIVMEWISKLKALEISHFALADTVGIADAETVSHLTKSVINEFTDLEIGCHLHCMPSNWQLKTDAAFNAGCRHFDTAILGFGGCPMADDVLVGNLATENLIQYLETKNVETLVNKDRLNVARLLATGIFHN